MGKRLIAEAPKRKGTESDLGSGLSVQSNPFCLTSFLAFIYNVSPGLSTQRFGYLLDVSKFEGDDVFGGTGVGAIQLPSRE